MKLEKPTYNTVQHEGLLPAFESSLVFKGRHYTGGVGRSKKEAEQLTARTVIRSLLGILTTSVITVVCFHIILGCVSICIVHIYFLVLKILQVILTFEQ